MRFSRVVLVNPCAYYATGIAEATSYPPLGLASIAAVLRDNGIACAIIDADVLRLRTRDVLDRIDRFKPDLVGISLSPLAVGAGKELCAATREHADARVCLGGIFTTSRYRALLRETPADFAIRGEGEFTLLELCQGKELGGIGGLAYRESDRIVVNAERPLIENLDLLPLPAHDLLPASSNYKSRTRKKPMAPIITSRGCPCTCGYCDSTVFGKECRARSPESVLSEIDLLVDKFKVRQIDILDDDFTFELPRAEKIFDLIADRRYDLVLNLHHGVRADRVTLPLVRKMKRAGVFKVRIRLEPASGDPPGFPESNPAREQLNHAFDWFRWNGIVTSASFTIGLPNDTAETIDRRIQFAIDLDPDLADFPIFVPFSETRAFDGPGKAGLLDDALTNGLPDGNRCPINGNLSREAVLALRARALRSFNMRPGKAAYTLLSIRSFDELKWFADTSRSILSDLFRGHRERPVSPAG